MGVQGLIFNCQSWFGGWDGQNHVHIELNLRGAAMKTTFWNKNVTYAAPDAGGSRPLQGQNPPQP